MDKRDNLEGGKEGIRKILYVAKEILADHEYAAKHDKEYPTDADLSNISQVITSLQSLLNSDKNAQGSDTTKVESNTEVDDKNSPSWKEIVQKEAEKAFGLLEINDFEVEAFSVGMNRAKDYYEKEVVEPLREQSEKRMRALESLTPSGSEYVNDIDACVKCVREQRDSTFRFIGKQNKEISALQEENERLKKALEKQAD